MTNKGPALLILGSGPNVRAAEEWPREWFDQIIVMNNAWRVRPDWDVLVYPEDFPPEKRPPELKETQTLVEADEFVPAQNLYGGFVHAGATMAYTTAYWALAALKPRVMAFMGCDMVYPKTGNTHFYGTGAPDPLREDISLRDLGAKSARLALIAAEQGCACLNLSQDDSSLLFTRAAPENVLNWSRIPFLDHERYQALRALEDALGYDTPDGRYQNSADAVDISALDRIDAGWRALLSQADKADQGEPVPLRRR